tara:strand:- start:1712 stop:1918 length:207 start_codon:yes stop_codon:yes gene_type:complete
MSQARDEADKLCMTFLMETDIPSKAISKQCALICVDKIIRNEINTTMEPNEIIMDYWKEVRNEIEKLC